MISQIMNDGNKREKYSQFRERLENVFGSPVKITHSLINLEWGGAERLLSEVLPHLAEAGFSVEVLALGRDGPVGDVLRKAGVKTTALKIQKRSSNKLYSYFEYLKNNKPHILHTHLFWPGIFCRATSRIIGIPKLICHEHYLATGLKPLRRKLEELTYFGADASISVSEAVAASRPYLKNKALQKKVIINCIDFKVVNLNAKHELRKSLGISDNEIVVGWVGRIDDDWKDLTNLIESASIVHRKNKSTKWLIVGGGPDEKYISERAKKTDAEFIFIGTKNNARDYYSTMDIFALPSKSEGLPMVIMEAMAAGIPVVATHVGGVPEIVEHEKTGLLVAPKNPQALADAVLSLIEDKEKAARFASAAQRNILENFNVDSYVEKLLCFYVSVAENR